MTIPRLLVVAITADLVVGLKVKGKIIKDRGDVV